MQTKKKLDKYLSLLLEDLEKDKLSLLECKEFDSIKKQVLDDYIFSGQSILPNQTLKYTLMNSNKNNNI